MNTSNKKEVKRILKSNLVIHSWDLRTKTLDFSGSVSDYLKDNYIKHTVKVNNYDGSERLSFTFSFNVGSLNKIKHSHYNLEDAVRMAINIRLTYLGKKSKYTFLGRTKTFNF